SLDQITYRHLMEFVSSGISNDIKKVRVWALHRFFLFLKVHRLLEVDIARELPYPKLEQIEPQFLTLEELTAILHFFSARAWTPQGLRNLLIVMIFGFLGLRLSTLRNLNIQDVILAESLLWVRDKGYVRRPVPIPQIICIYLYQYLKTLDIKMGPLFLSKRKKRISPRSVQYIFDIAESELDLNKHLHCHLFRHTAATQINQTAGVDITQSLLGHRSRRTTEQYIHLDGVLYADHMGHHPYHDTREDRS
ncbi:MAG: tyrosine-type recombinase/integrase, partial [Candidatus Sabulitectum sp.]|nr:tyrosine-type recombinase/integrase [Candidatus Sabulitectum sp.]